MKLPLLERLCSNISDGLSSVRYQLCDSMFERSETVQLLEYSMDKAYMISDSISSLPRAVRGIALGAAFAFCNQNGTSEVDDNTQRDFARQYDGGMHNQPDAADDKNIYDGDLLKADSSVSPDLGTSQDAYSLNDITDSNGRGCVSDWDCSDNEACIDTVCERMFEVICEEPCPLSEEYILARTEGIKRSILSLYALVETTIAPSLYPFGVRVHQDSFCGEYSDFLYSATYDIPSGVRADICMYDVERNGRVGYPLDPELAVNADISTIHEQSHLLWLDRARVPYVFQEAFSVGVSHFLASESIDSFCHSNFQVEDPVSIIDLSRNFWGSLCREYNFTNDKIPLLFEQINARRTELGRVLNLPEVKLILDSITEMDTTALFTTAGMALTPLSAGRRCTYNYECEEELHCNDGICQHLTCTDSDSGENPLNVRGTLTIERTLSTGSAVEDRCIDDLTVREVSCDSLGGGWVSFRRRCPEGTYCLDGAGACREN